MKLANKVATITGGSRGIGKATAKLFAEEGANVILYFASDDSSWVTGAILPIDGGAVIR